MILNKIAEAIRKTIDAPNYIIAKAKDGVWEVREVSTNRCVQASNSYENIEGYYEQWNSKYIARKAVEALKQEAETTFENYNIPNATISWLNVILKE